jgi:hypothetical protein
MKVPAIILSATISIVAIAQPGTPGWQHGGSKCGCIVSPTQTTADCNKCCNNAVIPTGPLTPGQVTQCLAFCAQMGQPCQTGT